MKQLWQDRHKYLGVAVITTTILSCTYFRLAKEADRTNYIGDSDAFLTRHFILRPKNTKKEIKEKKKTFFTPDNRRVTVIPGKPLQLDNYGLTFKLGLASGIIPPFLGMDVKYAFLNQWSLTAGLGYRFDYPNKGFTPFATLSYKLDYDLIQNTEVFIGILALPRQTGIIGIRVNL